MSVKEPLNSKRHELVPPDGGWGYVVWIALTINMIVFSVFVSCMGMIYNEMFIQLKMDSTSISILSSIGSISTSIAGFITGPFLSFSSIRLLGVVASIILTTGSFAIAFVKSKELFFITFGILESFGKGVLINLTFTTLNQYFVKKRMLTSAVIQGTTALVALFSPHFIKWCLEEYGLRGTVILISGIHMQTFIAIALIQPVEWHLKKIEIKTVSEDKDKELKTLSKENLMEKNTIASEKLQDTECLLTTPSENKEFNNSSVKENTRTNSLFREIFKDFFDVPFLKSFLFSNASIGLAIISFSDIIFIIMLPQALYFMEWSEGKVAWAIMLSNLGDLIVKILFILFSNILFKFRSNEVYIAGLIVAFFARLGMLWTENPTVMLVFIVMIGMSRSVGVLMFPLVIGDVVDKEKFTSALGIYMLQYGVIFLILGPVIGAVRDLTNSYSTAFYILTSCYGIVILFWLIELLYKKNKHKRVKKIKNRDSA